MANPRRFGGLQSAADKTPLASRVEGLEGNEHGIGLGRPRWGPYLSIHGYLVVYSKK